MRRSATRDFGKPSDYCENPIAFLVIQRRHQGDSTEPVHGYVLDITSSGEACRRPETAEYALCSARAARSTVLDPLTYHWNWSNREVPLPQ